MRILFILFFTSNILVGFSQQTSRIDSTKVEDLETVVITGQVNPQAVDRSVVEVKVINRDIIERQAGNTLADVLATTLNLSVIPQTSTGRSEVSLFGLDNQYFKVLVDNIPLVSERGFGNNTDLSTINLDDIERVEIVEGAMGVQYGANALTGIINIITKKSSREDWEVNVYTQQETIGDEFGFFDEGRHIQSLRLGHNFSDKFHINAGVVRNDFNGFLNSRQGRDYIGTDGLRGYEWLPKEQLSARATASYQTDDFKIFYRFEFLDEDINRFNDIVDLDPNPSTDTQDPFAIDDILSSNRMVHHLNTQTKLFNKYNFNWSLSYQEQEQERESFTYRILSGLRENITTDGFQSRAAYFSRATLSNLFETERFSLQVGNEITLESGEGTLLLPLIGTENSDVTQELNSYDFFVNSEFEIPKIVKLNPGFRVSPSNLFAPQYYGTLSAKTKLFNFLNVRSITGYGTKSPNYDELFTFFVDVNHDVRGNLNLIPETGITTSLNLSTNFSLFNKQVRVKLNKTLSYIRVRDRIQLIEINNLPLQYEYNNIDLYRFIGNFDTVEVFYKDFKLNVGLSSQLQSIIFNQSENLNDDFLYSFQMNANATYNFSKWDADLSLFYKYTGEQPRLRQTINADGEEEIIVGRNGSFGFFDATLRKGFLENQIVATVGARNLLDVTDINTTALDGGAHNGDPNALAVAYGRSYFVRLAYNLKI